MKIYVSLLLTMCSSLFAMNQQPNFSLHYAIETGQEAVVVEELLKPDVGVNRKNEEGNTPLHIAAQRGYLKIVEMLLSHGARASIESFNKE